MLEKIIEQNRSSSMEKFKEMEKEFHNKASDMDEKLDQIMKLLTQHSKDAISASENGADSSDGGSGQGNNSSSRNRRAEKKKRRSSQSNRV